MLYPYTDNYLDDPEISRQAKASFNARFERRLAGGEAEPCVAREETIWTEYLRAVRSIPVEVE
jgi:hypothetical protein